MSVLWRIPLQTDHSISCDNCHLTNCIQIVSYGFTLFNCLFNILLLWSLYMIVLHPSWQIAKPLYWQKESQNLKSLWLSSFRTHQVIFTKHLRELFLNIWMVFLLIFFVQPQCCKPYVQTDLRTCLYRSNLQCNLTRNVARETDIF